MYRILLEEKEVQILQKQYKNIVEEWEYKKILVFLSFNLPIFGWKSNSIFILEL